MKVLFVCTGNTCRSPMAEHLFRKMVKTAGKDVQVESAGVHPAWGMEWPREAQEALLREGLSGCRHTPKKLTKESVQTADLILAMEDHHRRDIIENFPEVSSKVYLLKEYAGLGKKGDGIQDPIGEPVEVYRRTLGDIKRCLEKILPKLP